MKGVAQEFQVEAFDWLKTAEHTEWKSFADVRKVFPKADFVDGLLVFNIGHNRFRLVVNPSFKAGRLYVKYFLTHKEYERGEWKKK